MAMTKLLIFSENIYPDWEIDERKYIYDQKRCFLQMIWGNRIQKKSERQKNKQKEGRCKKHNYLRSDIFFIITQIHNYFKALFVYKQKNNPILYRSG